MSRKRRKSETPPADLPMTPMIDVVFQLLIYFLVTIKPIDVIAHLDVFRPAPDPNAKKDEPPPKLIQIAVFEDGFTMNETRIELPEMERLLGKLASIDNKQTILIKCTANSRHESLIQVLDLCAKSRLVNLSVMSTN